MPGLSLALLGKPELALGGRPLAFRTRKAQALLIYLAVEGRAHTREELTLLFWPESEGDKGRGMLRTSLAHLRQALGEVWADYLLVEEDSLRFNLQSDYDLDLNTLTLTLKGGTPAEEHARQLLAAVEAYKGEFLAGFNLADAPEFDSWASQQREQWHWRLSQVLEALAPLQMQSGDREAALQTAQRWVHHDPLNETAYQQLMRTQAALGRRTAALQTYEAARTILARELGTEPGPDLTALAKRLQHEAASPTQAASPKPPATEAGGLPLASLPMVGRVNEFAELIAVSYSVRRGATQVVSLEGEAGIGKTRLAAEFINWAVADGLDAWQGRAFETGGQLPYQPLVAALRERLERENAPDDLLGDVWLAELSRLLPELRERYPDLPQTFNSGEAEAQTRLFEAVARLGLAVAQHRPVLLFVDDVQWADSASLNLLNYVVRRWAEAAAPILILLTLRAEAQASMGPWLAALGRTIKLTHLPLGMLTIDHTQQLVQALAQPTASPAAQRFSQWLFAETEGQPFFLIELLKALADQGALVAALARGGGGAALPSSVRDLVSTRLARLSVPAADLLTAGAVLGQTADFETLCQVAGLNENEGLRALDELLAARLLAEQPVQTDDPARYVFAHDKIRDVVYREAGAARQRVFHRRAFTVLEAQAAPAAALAHHARAAGLAERAYTLSIAAGDEALQLFAIGDALPYYQAAEQWLLGAGQALSAESQHHLYRQLGRAHELNTDRASARAVYERMLTAARALGNGAMESTALNRLATLASQEVDYDRAFELLHTAQKVSEASGDRLGLVEAEWALAQLGIYQLDCEAAYQHAVRALALARETGETELIARCLNAVTFAEKGLAKVETLFDHGLEATALYAGLGNRAMQADSLMLVADAHILNGNLAEGVRLTEESLALCRQIGNRWGEGNSLLHLGQGLADLGRYTEAIAAIRQAVEISGDTPYVPLFALGALGAIYRSILNLEQAYATHTDLMAQVVALDYPPGFLAMIASELCADCVALGRWDEALRFAQQASDHRNYTVLPSGHSAWPDTLALAHGGALDRARQDLEWYRQALAPFRRHQVSYLRAKGLLAQAQGQTQAAREHWRAAVNLAEEIGLADDRWQLYVLLGKREQATAVVRPLVEGLEEAALRETFEANLAALYGIALDPA